MTEQADGAKRSDVDVQHNIGKIEVVVLRCDYDDVPAAEPRAQIAQVAGPAAKTSVKAPSGKAPSAKPASAASVGLGGLFGFFDGACDLDLDGAGEDPSASAPHAEYSDGEWDEVHSYLSNDSNVTHGQQVNPVDYPADPCLMPPFGLDGHDYEYPKMIFDPYDRPTEPRVPYYHTSGVRRPRQPRFDDPRLLAITSPVTGSRHVEFGPRAQPFTDPTSSYAPVDRQPPYPDSPADFQYHADRDFTRRSPSPQYRRYRSFSRDRRDQPLYLDSPAGFRYHADRDLTRRSPSPQKHRRRSHSGGCRHERQVEFVEHAVEELPDIDPDFQRFLIFQMPEKVERLLEVDHRFVADAVSYMPQLRKVPIAKLGFEATQNLKRNLKKCLAYGCYPNGDSIRVLVEPHERGQKYMRHKSPLRQFASDHERAGSRSRWNDTAEDRTWMDAFANIRVKDDESRHGGSITREGSTHKNGHVEGGEKTHTGSNKGESGSQKEESDTPWGQNGVGETQEATAFNEWDLNKNDSAEQGGQTGNWGNTDDAKNSSKGSTVTLLSEEQNKPDNSWGLPKTGDNGGSGKPSHQAPPSHHSRSSTSTDPHAYVQPYFQTWRGNGKPSVPKPRHRQPREPYTYLASPTPYVPADQVGDRSHGVRPGKGADYTHKTCRPKYLDQLDDPYAVFVFNYRSAEKLERILQYDVKGDLASIAEEVGRGVLMNMPRERLVEELMKSQAKAPDGHKADPPKGESGAAPRARSTKSASHGHKSVREWSAAVASRSANGQEAGFTPYPGSGSVKGAKAPVNDGWAAVGEGAVVQGAGFKADEGKSKKGFAGW